MLAVFLTGFIYPDTAPAELEARLSTAKGKERISLLAELTRAYRMENPQKALQFGWAALELLKRFPDKKIHAAVLREIGYAHRVQGDIDKSREYTQESLAIARENNDKSGIASALYALGNLFKLTSEFDRALEYFSKSAELYKKLKDQDNLALLINSIALVHWDKADYPKALDYFFQGLKIYEDIDNRKGISDINGNIGLIYWQLKEWDKSLEHYHSSIKIKEELKDNQGIATIHNNIGLVYFDQKKYREALEEYNKAYKISKESMREPLHSMIMYNLGCAHKELGNNQQALHFFYDSLAIVEKQNNKDVISSILIRLASLHKQEGNYKEALQLGTRALQLAEEIKVNPKIRDACKGLSETYEAMKDTGKALEYYKKFKEINDGIFNEDMNKRIATLETTFQLERSNRQVELLKKDRENQDMLVTFLVLFAFLIILLVLAVYTRYRLKAKANRDLHQEIIVRKTAEAKLRESEEKFRVLAERSVVGIRIIQDGIIKYANPRSAETFGFSPGEMLNKNPLDLVLEEDRPLVALNLEQCLNGCANSRPYEFRGITKPKEIINLESYGALTLYDDQPAVLESVIDITRRKIAESELIKARKMEAVGILAGGIAHDFNNLLAVILGNNSMLKLRYGEMDPKMNNFLDGIEKASTQAADLAQKFITFSEGGWLSKKKIRLSSLLKETGHFSPEIEEIHFDTSLPPDLDLIFGDERQLCQVMANLVLNAYEAAPPDNPQISITAQNLTLGTDNPFSLKEGKYVNISVKDNGKGIPVELGEKIFDPYFTTKNTVSQKGLGLGLPICYSIIKKHGGHIAITSEVQKGTRVDLYLPVFSPVEPTPHKELL